MDCKRYCWQLCLVLVVLFSAVATAQTLDMQQVDALLVKIAAYDYGASREPLTQWHELERSAAKISGQQLVLEKKTERPAHGQGATGCQTVCLSTAEHHRHERFSTGVDQIAGR